MKGLLFNELIEFAERRLGFEVAARALEGVRPYSAVESYPSTEFVGLVEAFAAVSSQLAEPLLRAFGEHLFARFTTLYPIFFTDADSAFGFLAGLDTRVHADVKTLYPDAEFPRFEPVEDGPGRLILDYRSRLPLASLAEGLLRGCVAHFGESIEVHRERVEGLGKTAAHFVLTRTSRA